MATAMVMEMSVLSNGPPLPVAVAEPSPEAVPAVLTEVAPPAMPAVPAVSPAVQENRVVSSKKVPLVTPVMSSKANVVILAEDVTILPVMITHTVLPTDTLQGIALRYNVKASVIKKHNDFLKDRVDLCKTLTFPAKPLRSAAPLVTQVALTPAQLLRKKIRTAYFRTKPTGPVRHTKSSGPKTVPVVAVASSKWIDMAMELPGSDIQSYLSLHDNDIDAAFAAIRNDMEWEIQQKMAKR